MMKDKSLVSVIIPTFNSAKYIDGCLDSIGKQTYKEIEVIVVDQSSTDGTSDLIKKRKIKLITLPKPKFYSPPTVSRNKGASISRGAILFHIDSDMVLSTGLIAEMVKKFDQKNDVGALVVHEEDITKGYWSRCKAFERKCYWGNDNIESARAVKRDIFKKVGGYDETLSSGEDFDIHKRYKKYCKIGFCENVVYHNLGSLSFMKAITKKYNYGKTAGKYFKKHHTSGQSIFKEQLKCYLKNYSSILKNPIIGLGSVFLKVSEFGAGGVGLLINKI